MIKVGIVGMTGYAGAELARLLYAHPEAEVVSASSVSYEGEIFSDVYPAFQTLCDLPLENEDTLIEKSEVIFAALPHGLSQKLAQKVLADDKIFIDLGADFRLESEETYEAWYDGNFIDQALHQQARYGLPELFRSSLKGAKLIANPGCYTTAVPLALAPLVDANLLTDAPLICDCKSGVTGAGRGLSLGTHYPSINESLHAYKVANHRHTPEMEQTLNRLKGSPQKVVFVPHLVPMNRGILATCYGQLQKDISIKDIYDLYETFYRHEPFVRLAPLGTVASTGHVRCSNFCDISVHKDERTGQVICISAIDNMVKGAAGQAVQNMNLACELPETAGLLQVPPAF